ncbi:hypothetical protein [Streptomyces sp. SID5643]|uniref:hypothetical protein n=1 Tax=Streptomyces sp. SID5643 TaxID=2690307 RepID=UPI00137188BC|nr:hypothetical protein [Streptomyces sp. SID5643]MZF84256.1 hypothetical protein [Streptomyces sp. SID5643]MZF85641.1 hypothetical protein [Streptomyces sp. SID5643]
MKSTVALSAYERKARLTPGMLGIAPVTITLVALGLKAYPAVPVALGVLSVTVGGYALSVLVGNAGRRAQDRMYERWGGRPTTQLLRTRDESSNPRQRDIWRQAIEEVTGVQLLSKRREAANSVAADHAIEAATDQVRYLGQDPRFPMVANENAAYGFERNMWGFRWVGRYVALVCLAVIGLTCLLARYTSFHVSAGAAISGAVINVMILTGWCLFPSEERAKEAGFRYARQLLHAVTQVSRTESSSATEETQEDS